MAAHRSAKAIFLSFPSRLYDLQFSLSTLPAVSGSHKPRRWDSLCFYGPEFLSAVSSLSSQCSALGIASVCYLLTAGKPNLYLHVTQKINPIQLTRTITTLLHTT